jgi:hypothetical protein
MVTRALAHILLLALALVLSLEEGRAEAINRGHKRRKSVSVCHPLDDASDEGFVDFWGTHQKMCLGDEAINILVCHDPFPR